MTSTRGSEPETIGNELESGSYTALRLVHMPLYDVKKSE